MYLSEMKKNIDLQIGWRVGKWASKRNGMQKYGIRGNQDGGRAIMWKSGKRLKCCCCLIWLWASKMTQL